MNNLIKITAKSVAFFCSLLLITSTLFSQSNEAYENAKEEITQTFGTFLTMFEAIPEHALDGNWETFKQMQGPENTIPPKYRELLQLAVASQIPCEYCVYFHIAAATAYGATEVEIEEAVAHGAQARHWSMILQGTQTDIVAFKAEMDAAMKYMSENSGK